MAIERQRWKWWRYNEMFALLDIWSDPVIQEELDGTKRNTHVYNKISELLEKRGITRSANQVREKMKTLKRAYWALSTKPRHEIEGKKMILCDRMAAILNRSRPDVEVPPHSNSSSNHLNDEESLHYTENNTQSDKDEMGDDKNGLHLLLSMGDNPCHLDEGEEVIVTPETLEFHPSRKASCSDTSILLNVDDMDDEEITIESHTPSPDIQCSSPITLLATNNHQFQDEDATTTSRRMTSESNSHNTNCKNKRFVEMLADTLISKFIEAQTEMEKRFLALESQRFKEEMRLIEKQQDEDRHFIDKFIEMEERRRTEDREHEIKIFSILANRLNVDPQTTNKTDSSSSSSDSPSASSPVVKLAQSLFTSNHVSWEFKGTLHPSHSPATSNI